MMDNIQVIIADRQYQGALENQNATIKPYKKFPVPTSAEFQEYVERVDLSLRAILDSPIGVYQFKEYVKVQIDLTVLIDFLVQYERIKALETPDLNSSRDLMETAFLLPPIYEHLVEDARRKYTREFGKIVNISIAIKKEVFKSDEDPLAQFENKAYRDIQPSETDAFPDSTAPVHSTNFGHTSVFGGFLHQNRVVARGGVESAVDTDILSPTSLKIMSNKKRKELKEIERKKKLMEDTGEGDFQDRQVATRQQELDEKARKKRITVQIFADLAEKLVLKAEEMLQKFKDNTEEFKEMINVMWYSELKVEADDFLMFRDLGRGAFGVVSAAKTKTTGTLTAIKCMNKKLIKGKKARRLVVAEKAILEVLGDNPSSFTIWLKYSFQDKDAFYMAIPLCTGGDLAYHLKERFIFSIARAMFTFAEVLEGIDHLHNLTIVYRDLKPENIIFDAEGHARISDMGLAIQTGGRKIRGKAGTPGYWAPEVISKQPYSFSADHWSLGCIFYEMLIGVCPFSSSNTRMERNEATLKWELKFPKKYGKGRALRDFPEGAMEVISGLLDRNRSKRFGAKEVREHEYFKGLDWYKLQTKQLEPPWSPDRGVIHAPDQIELDFKSKDRQFKKIKLEPEDEIENFDYASKYSHELDIVQVLETRNKNKLEYDNYSDPHCCIIF